MTSFGLSIGMSALILLYWLLMVSGAGADGMGWLLATIFYVVMVAYLGGAALATAALATAGAAWARSKEPRAVLGLGLAAVSLGLWVWLRMAGPIPRGPLG